MTIALLFFGISRCLKHTYPTIKKYIFDELDKNNIKYDIYFHTYLIDGMYNNKWSKEINVTYDNEDYKILKAHYVMTENQDEIKLMLNLKEYHENGDPWHSGFDALNNYILGCYSRYQVYNMMKKSDKKYKYVIFIRPDQTYKNPLPVNLFHLCDENENNILVPNFALYPDMNDRFSITCMHKAHVIGELFLNMKQDSKVFNMHSERYLYFRLLVDYKMNIIFFNNFYFDRTRTNGSRADNFKLARINTKYVINNFIHKICLYTVITSKNNKNINFLHKERIENVFDTYIFTDNNDIIDECKKYYITGIYVDFNETSAKSIKINPTKFLPKKYDYSIFVDQSVKVTNYRKLNQITESQLVKNSKSLVLFSFPIKLNLNNNHMEQLKLFFEQILIDKLSKTNTNKIYETVLIRNNNHLEYFNNDWLNLNLSNNIPDLEMTYINLLITKHSVNTIILDIIEYNSMFAKA